MRLITSSPYSTQSHHCSPSPCCFSAWRFSIAERIISYSYLTYAAGETTDLKTLQAMAGHSNIQMTMDHYVHVQPEKLKELGNKMHNLFVQ